MYRELPVWRSLMYVPVNVEKFVDKAHTRGADVIQPAFRTCSCSTSWSASWS